mmetsp:Transcript_9958/g.23165  ORF Transcript_9958/g.23165 Transcript_9958/m.23165 type:complete len:85 (+) Transcript_9958:216-470(+)
MVTRGPIHLAHAASTTTAPTKQRQCASIFTPAERDETERCGGFQTPGAEGAVATQGFVWQRPLWIHRSCSRPAPNIQASGVPGV